MIVYFAVGVDALKFLSPPPQVSSGYLARNIDFNCSTDDANATVKLFFAADFVNFNERTLSLEKLHLNKQVFTLLNLGVRDGGQYRCKATDGKKTIEWPSTHGLLFLSQGKLPDIILDPPRPIIIQQGQTGKITCQALGWSVSKLAWKKRTDSGDQNVPDSKVTNVVDKSENLVKATLTFTNAQPQDSGEYKCVLTAFNKQDYKLANIRVDAPQPPTLYPYNGGTTVNEGTEKTLRCIAKASPKANITWYRHGKELQNTTSCSPSDEKECKTVYEVYEDDPTSSLHTTFTKQVLQIHGAMYPRDQGEFKCIAMNGIGQPVELIIDLDILAPPAIDKERDEIPAKEGLESKVICKVTKSNPLPTFTWKYQTVKCEDCVPDESNWIDVPSYLLLTPPKQTNLSEVRVEKSQSAAFYHCQADNGVGNDTHIVKLVRLELVAPDISKLPDKAAIQDEDFQVQLYCNATGHPKPTLNWYFERNGEKVHINEKGEGLGGNVDACQKRTSGYFFLVDRNPSDLVICRPKLQHIGKYTCRASNPRFKVKEQSAFINVFISTPVTRAGGSPLSTGALVGIAIGVGVLVLLVLVICCVVYRRQKRQIDEYKEIYFLRSSDYQVLAGQRSEERRRPRMEKHEDPCSSENLESLQRGHSVFQELIGKVYELIELFLELAWQPGAPPLSENPYLALELDDDEGVESQGYYLQPCDSGLRDSKRYVESPISSPTGELPPNTTPEGAGMGYDSPLPALPPGLDVMSDDEIKNAPLPSIPPSYEEALSDEDESRPMRGGRTNSAAGESGIDVDGLDDGDYIDDIRGDTPFLSPVEKIPETDVLQKGNRRKIETAL
ncbi:hypothetical protein pdam_00001670 [Pocillopora damicornis]|uniref:Ig-like domain-containing protein n=1 Tax=Pocillopora damicornis TaxID=46731 RepID=A0A3M6UPE2_POCDA|nr:hypothetical protein pdam_00001670 [Pocillopora damicornis]